MTTQNYFVMSSAQRVAVMAFNDPDASINPRAIDSPTPGSGINTNELAVGYAVGDPVTLLGQYVAPVRIVNDPDYQNYVPDMVAYLLDLPSSILENETIFLPDEPV